MEIIPKVSNGIVIKSGNIELEIHESDNYISIKDLNKNCKIEYPEVLIKGSSTYQECKVYDSVRFLIKPYEEKDVCKWCKKIKSEHFHKHEKQYDEGLRDRYYCTKSGIRQFALVSGDEQ